MRFDNRIIIAVITILVIMGAIFAWFENSHVWFLRAMHTFTASSITIVVIGGFTALIVAIIYQWLKKKKG